MELSSAISGTRVDFTDRKDAEEQLRAVRAQVINAREMERYDIGQKLHDDLAQRITAVSIGLTGLSKKYDPNANLAADFDDLQRQASAICIDIVQFSYQLCPPTVECPGVAGGSPRPLPPCHKPRAPRRLFAKRKPTAAFEGCIGASSHCSRGRAKCPDS
jgi:Histidine kinase